DGPVDITARIVIAADGLGGRVLRPSDAIVSTPNVYSRIGAGATCDDPPAWCGHGVIYMFCGHGGYVGIARQEEGKGAVGAAFDVGFVKDQGGLALAAAAIIKQASGRDAAWARA